MNIQLAHDKKVYFASDFHLGAPSGEVSTQRELAIIDWLTHIEKDCSHLFLIGDIFDFWFEYKRVIPKGFERFKAKLLHLKDLGIDIHFFIGNHDMWMFDYFPSEFGIPVHRDPIQLVVGHRTILVGHGDGLGPGDHFYKVLKKIFRNRLMQRFFGWAHPDFGIWIADLWSNHSKKQERPIDRIYKEEEEYIYQYCLEQEKTAPRDFYIFGHRHLPIRVAINSTAEYINSGEWLGSNSFVSIDHQGSLELKAWDTKKGIIDIIPANLLKNENYR